MADQDFNIKVVTTADTSGIREVDASLDTLRARQRSLAAQFPQGLPSEEAEAVAESTEKAATETEALAAGGLLAGTNLGKARQEAAVLARELATGGNVTRTLGSLLGALGPQITVAAIGGLFLFEEIKKIREESQKLIADTAKLGQQLEENAIKAQGAVTGARTGDDISKVAEGLLSDLEKVHARANELNQQTISFWQKQMEDMREGIIQMSPTVTDAMKQWAHPFTLELQEAQRQANDMASFADHEARRRIERSKDFKRQEEELTKIPYDEAISKLVKRIEDATQAQNALTSSGEDYTRSWLSNQAIIDNAKKDLRDLAGYHERLEKKIGDPSAQAKAIDRNEEAARRAHAAGQDRDAEMFQKSADAFRRGASPQDLQQVSELKGAREIVSAIERMRDDWK
jgi:hypothetical protein